MKKSLLFTAAFRIMGIILLVLGIRMVGEGIYNYIDEHHQTDWIVTTASVVDVSRRYSSSRHGRDISYDITYTYEVEGNSCSGVLYNRTREMAARDTVTVKYDPDAPENSTDILAPSLKNLIVFLVFGTVLGLIGFFLSGLWALIHRIRRRGAPEEELLPPEEYVQPGETFDGD